jgi:hypothetical protein
MRQHIEHLRNTITSWPGMTAEPHRFGGIEFKLNGVEIGHVHHHGMVDIPFNSQIRDQLIAEGRAEVHHLLKDTGWITFYIRQPEDVEQAIWLFRLSYLFYARRGRSRTALAGQINIPEAVAALRLSESMQAVFERVTTRPSAIP